MINFCHACLKPVMTCDKVCADDYGVENLQAGQDFLKSQRGFRTERFIGPPVCVTVQFPCKVNIARIIIDPAVGRQKSCGFEIFTSQKLGMSWLQDETRHQQPIKTNSSNLDDEVFMLIGKERMTEAVVVCFDNPLYRPRGQFSEFKQKPIISEKHSVLRHHRSTCITSVSSVKIRIVSTVDRSSPALKCLQIWGQPSSSCSISVQRRVFELYKATLYLGVSASSTVSDLHDQNSATACTRARTNSSSSTVSYDSNEICNKIDENDVTIPEEFIDPITCDIMTVPLTLPSGKTVDQLTLDKHINADAMWGRPPSDPFTGVPFNDCKKPVTNVPLKVRIDHFVLTHSSKLKTVPRVLGRANKCDSQELSALPAITTSTTNQTVKAKGRALKRKLEHVQNNELINVSGTKSVKIEPEKPKASGNILSRNHETKLTESLDAALFATLGNLPSFQSVQLSMQTDVVNSSLAKSSPCINCPVPGDHPNLYKLSCDHVLCKKCLTKLMAGSNSGKCPACHEQFMSKDIERFNV